MELEVSQKTQKICNALKLPAEGVAFADLVAVGWEPEDAYVVAFRKGSTWLKKAFRDEVKKMMDSQNIKDRIAQIQGITAERRKENGKQGRRERNSIVDTAMSKENMLYDLQTAKLKMTVGTKEWLDTNKLIVDVTRMKQDEVVNEETTIHYFLPVQYPTGCQDCLYQRCDTCKYKKAYEEQK